jgi:hypothetical protein
MLATMRGLPQRRPLQWLRRQIKKVRSALRTATSAQPRELSSNRNGDPQKLDFDQALAFLRDHRPELVVAPRYLIPSAHKLYDFRQEAGFSQIAGETLAQGRTLLDYNRLYTLWQAVQNTRSLGFAAAEVGTFRGGSARFLGAALRFWSCAPPIYVFDTFTGHPPVIDSARDGPHLQNVFSDTSVEAVRDYLSEFPNIQMHVGALSDTCWAVADCKFALVHVDVDIYHSTVQALAFFWPRLVEGGVIVIDDYGFTSCVGLKEAVDQFIKDQAPSRLQGWYIHTGQFVITRQSTK